uniref:Large ribosomal subunit protein uL23c n=1 Tax=Chlamydomonas applanata TaxID=35704 RepID=A0A0S2LPN1_CHLAP|nr:ribosomal protein L23 [Chlamydomonas applanata]
MYQQTYFYTISSQKIMTEKTASQNKWEAALQQSYALQSMVDYVKYPVITEKTYLELYNKRQYTFDVDKRLNKTQIKKLIEGLFDVNVIAVNTHIPPRKRVRVGFSQGYRPLYKRAIITLKEGQSINYSLKKESV